MARFRRMLAPINTTKHYLHHAFFTVAAAAITNNDEVNAVALSAVTNANDVQSGSIVKAIYIEYWMSGDSASAQSTFNITVEKVSGGQPDMTFANAVNLMAYPNKKNVLYTTQGLVGDSTNNAVPIIRQWIAIPKGKQRFGLGDQLRTNIASITGTIRLCGIVIFKEYN